MKTKKRTVIVNKKRFFIFILLSIILLLSGFSSVKSHFSGNTKEFVAVYVSSGDTLWNIASKNNYENKDIRKLVYEIKKFNNLNSNTIYAGDKILIPV